MATETPVKRRPRPFPKARTVLTAEQRGQLATDLTNANRPSFRELAEKYGTSASLVQRLNAQLHPEAEQTNGEDPDAAQAELERLIGKNLPPERLVRELAGLIRGAETPKSVKLMAIRTATELRGIVTRKEKRDAEANASQPAPIFVFTGLAPSAAPPQVVDQGQDKPALPSISKPELDKSTG